ncbi:MAG: winged helix-turn-helix transcriptional regulator [Bacteroidetes bacterium]|nr:winged helix-turn-helix transcriptional regulator [Bacteroidota bacterium]
MCDKEKRFNRLKRDLGTITPRTLTKKLKYLEMNKLVIRGGYMEGSISFVYLV